MDTAGITESLNDPFIRAKWLDGCFEEIRQMNLEVDRRLLTARGFGLIDLCARRKAYQDMLESVFSIRRQMVRPNPRSEMAVNLDRVTA